MLKLIIKTETKNASLKPTNKTRALKFKTETKTIKTASQDQDSSLRTPNLDLCVVIFVFVLLWLIVHIMAIRQQSWT